MHRIQYVQHKNDLTFNGLFFQDSLGKQAPERLTNLYFNKARHDSVAVVEI